MNKSNLVQLLVELNNGDPFGTANSFEDIFKDQIDSVIEKLSLNHEEIPKNFTLNSYKSENTYEWKYVCLNFHLLNLINQELNKAEDAILSVQETKKVKASLRNLLIIGILKNYQSNLPHSIQLHYHNPTNIIYNYEILKATINGFIDCINVANFRLLIIPNCLQGILVGVLQLGYAPLKKPSSVVNENEFNLTEGLYEEFKRDQEYYRNVLVNLRQNIHYSIFIVELMQLFRNNTPQWFKIAISKFLTNTLKIDNGIERITTSLFDCYDDTTKNWKTLEILSKLIVGCRKFTDFQTNICVQLEKSLDTNKELKIFERLYVQCTKTLFIEDEDLCKTVFLSRILSKFTNFTDKNHTFSNNDLTEYIKQTVCLIYGTFIINPPCLPINLLQPVINVIFQFYILTNETNFQQINKELCEIFLKYLENVQNDSLFDNFLFNLPVKDVPQVRNDITIKINENIIVENSDYNVVPSVATNIRYFYRLLTIEQKIRLFGYLLRCITNKEKYFLGTTDDDLLNIEEHPINSTLENLIEIHKLLTQLADDATIQEALKQKPDDIIDYISITLNENYDKNTDTIFIIIMILENLLESSLTQNNLIKFQILLEPIKQIINKTTNTELRLNCEKIYKILNEQKLDFVNNRSNGDERSEFDRALDDMCDPILPVRGHALMVLSKLVEQKNQQAMERKQYLLNLFQLSLKDEDSYIYLNAVQGLAALADVFPDTILEVLCEEYSSFNKKSNNDALETRMKLGEVLVRIIKLLGEMAPKYKALLLNTFLSGTKDDDHLIRASSLSNLGEVCRVLGYKLGSIVTEVLVCIHAIITTDKAVEARRAAVTVIRQLFVGIDTEMIAFLKDDILPIYRTLKEIYYNDKDDVMRLQAQLALEELNENMKNFVFPKQQLNVEKKIIMLN